MDAANKANFGKKFNRETVGTEASGNDGMPGMFPTSCDVHGWDGKKVNIKFSAGNEDFWTVDILYHALEEMVNIWESEDFRDAVEISFGGKVFPGAEKLADIHKIVDLNMPGVITFKKTDMATALGTMSESRHRDWKCKINRSKELSFCSYIRNSEKECEKLACDFFVGISDLKHLFKVEYLKVNCFYGREIRLPATKFEVKISIDGKHAEKILNEYAAGEINRLAPLIAQAIRQADKNSLGMLPIDVLCRLGPLLASDLPEETAVEFMKAKIFQAEKAFLLNKG